MTTAISACENPMCGCTSCSCTNCRCGTARLGDLEGLVMDVVWERSRDEPTVRDVGRSFPDLAYTTVATMLDRLVEKGVARCRMDGRTRRFSAHGSRADYTAMYMYDALRKTGEPSAALARFAETVTPAEAKALGVALQRRGRTRTTR